MATFEDVVNKAKSAAETAGKKTSDFLEATRLKVDAAEVEKELAYTMEGLGRLLYDEKKTGEDRSTQIEDGIRRADELNARLNELRDPDLPGFRRRCAAIDAVRPIRRMRPIAKSAGSGWSVNSGYPR